MCNQTEDLLRAEKKRCCLAKQDGYPCSCETVETLKIAVQGLLAVVKELDGIS